ncbi:hypothetical protein ACFSQ7_10745 [Paenibacillus rhizoplanae]
MLSESGVEQAEVGIPAMGKREQEDIAAVAELGLPMKLMTWNRSVPGDIDKAKATGVNWSHISIPVSEIQLQGEAGADAPGRAEQAAAYRGIRAAAGHDRIGRHGGFLQGGYELPD